jgi:hypothetical protein
MYTFQVSSGKRLNVTTFIYAALPAYTGHGTGFEGIKKANVEILENAILAVERLCPNLQVWIFQTGGKVVLI